MPDRSTATRPGLAPAVLAPVALALAAAALVWVAPEMLDTFSVNVLTRSLLYAALAVTVDLLWGFTGILTFGQAAFFGAGAYATAIVLTHLGASPAWVLAALALSVLVPMALGALVGWLSFHHGSTPLYASVISLVFPIVVTQLVYSGGEWTGSSSGLVGYDTLPLDLPGFFRLAGIFAVLVALGAWVFVRSDAGKLLVAVRDNDARCSYLGISPTRVSALLTVALAGVAGLTGFLFAQASGVVAPENTGFLFGTELVIWVALGGRGTVLGPVLGAIAIDYAGATLSGDLPFLWQLILGSAFVVVIILLPDGLAGAIRRGWTRVNARRDAAAPAVVALPASGAAAGGAEPLLVVTGLGKRYGSLSVLDGIDLAVRPGELVSLVGPNGAGKTTLMRCLSDGTEPYQGSVQVAGRNTRGMTPERIVALGLGRKFQVASVFDSLSVADCLRLARAARDRPSPLGAASTLRLPAASLDILRLTGLDTALAAPVRLLSHGQRQALELAMVVALEPKLILLDEPTAGLTKAERTTIGTILRRLTADLGCAAVLVEHDLDFVREISTRVVVLHGGRLVLDGTVAEVVDSDLVRAVYAGAAHA